jgi:hypothetical protein
VLASTTAPTAVALLWIGVTLLTKVLARRGVQVEDADKIRIVEPDADGAMPASRGSSTRRP